MSDKASFMNLVFNAGVRLDDDYFIAASANFNGLFKVNINTGESKYLGSFPSEPRFRMRLFFEGYLLNNRIFFSPQFGRHIGVYCLYTNEFIALDIPEYIRKWRIKCSDIVAYNDNIYILSANARFLLEINSESLEQNIYRSEYDKKTYCQRAYLWQGHMYTTSNLGDELFDWDLNTKECVVHHLEKEFRGAISLCEANGRLWIAPHHSGDPIVIYDSQCQKKEYIFLNREIENDRNYEASFLYSFYDGKTVHMIAQSNGEAICIDPMSFKISLDTNMPVNEKHYRSGVYIVTKDDIILSRVDNDSSYYWGTRDYIRYNLPKRESSVIDRFYISSEEESYQNLNELLLEKLYRECESADAEYFLNMIKEII